MGFQTRVEAEEGKAVGFWVGSKQRGQGLLRLDVRWTNERGRRDTDHPPPHTPALKVSPSPRLGCPFMAGTDAARVSDLSWLEVALQPRSRSPRVGTEAREGKR